MRLNPQYPPGYLRVLALSQFHQERYERGDRDAAPRG